ncbi:MAG: SRPBCC family protein [Verrucomicrobia bacterium]|nr:SRPBCC family protein [Verrucomicrobiota bacterium]
MYSVQHTVAVLRAPERVWTVFEDVADWPRWNPVTPSAHWLTEGQWRRGARLALTLRLRQKRRLIRPDVVAVVPNVRVSWVSHGVGVKTSQTFTFSAEGPETRVTATETLSGPLAFLFRLFVPPSLIRATLVLWLDALKSEAER